MTHFLFCILPGILPSWIVVACTQDIIGYSKLGEEAVIGFVVTVMARVAAMLDDFSPDQRPVVRNT